MVHSPKAALFGNPPQDSYPPNKFDVVALLDWLQTAVTGGGVVVNSLAALNALTPSKDGAAAGIYGSATKSENGIWSGSTTGTPWTKIADWPITFAGLTNVGGSSNAITADLDAFAGTGSVRMVLLTPTATNSSGGVTLAIDGGAAEDITSGDGGALTAGDLGAGTPVLLSRSADDTEWRLVWSVNAVTQAQAAQAAAEAAAAGVANTRMVFEYTVSVAQAAADSLSGADDHGQTLAYEPGDVFVTVNGSDLALDQFAAGDGTTVTFVDGVITAGDLVKIHAYNQFVLASHPSREEADARYMQKSGVASDADLLAAYQADTPAIIKPSFEGTLPCDPTGGDDFFDMAYWLARKQGDAVLQLADGLHDVSSYVETRSILSVQGRYAPDFYQITAISFAAVSGNTYTATVTVSTALPSRVVAGFAVSLQNCKGDGGAHAINGAHIVKTVAGDRLSFTFDLLVYGTAPAAVTTLDNTLTLSLTANQVAVPQACLRPDAAGWDGAAKEGFINGLEGSFITLKNLGLSYNGPDSEHDMLFARGGDIYMEDRVYIAGAGDKVLRSAYGGRFHANRSAFGGHLTADNIWQGAANTSITMIRCCCGSTTADMFSPTASSRVLGTACVLASGARAGRTTYAESSIEFIGGTRFRHFDTALRADLGKIEVSAAEDIQLCDNPLEINGPGFIYGNPSISNCTNATIANNTPINGGGWYKEDDRISPFLPAVTTIINLPDIASGATHTEEIDYPGIDDNRYKIDWSSTNAPNSQQLLIDFKAKQPDKVLLIAHNISGGSIDQTAATIVIQARDMRKR